MPAPADGPLLAVDTASPQTSAALAYRGKLLAEASEPGGPGARPLVALLDEVTRKAGISAAEISRLVVVRGPGSFTGLRLGMATAWALHEALGMAVLPVTTFEALAWQVETGEGPVLALVDALRAEWYCQRLEVGNPPRALDEPRILPAGDLPSAGARVAIGFGVSRLAPLLAGCELREAPPLARRLAEASSLLPLRSDPALLLAPLYLRPPTPETRLAERRADV